MHPVFRKLGRTYVAPLLILSSAAIGFAVSYGIDNHGLSNTVNRQGRENSALRSEIQGMGYDYEILTTLYNEAKSRILPEDAVGPHSSFLRYPVQEGDNLWTVAQKLKGDGGYWSELSELNKLEDPYAINNGEKLFFPATWVPSRNPRIGSYNIDSPPLPVVGQDENWIMIDVTDGTLSLMRGQNTVKTFPAATGRGIPRTETDWYSTAPGIYRIITYTGGIGFLGGFYSADSGLRFDPERLNGIESYDIDADGKIVRGRTGPGLTTGEVALHPDYLGEVHKHAGIGTLIYVKW